MAYTDEMSSIIERFNNRYRRHLVAENIQYSPKSTLDVYAAPWHSDKKRPVIIFWYGGTWQTGNKSLYRFVADYLARMTGALVIVPDYEKYPVVQYPYFITEAWQVVSWIQQHAADYGADFRQYSVIGHSSGAHTACMIALGAHKPDHLEVPDKCVSIAGPNETVGEQFWPIFNMTNYNPEAFPIHHVPSAQKAKVKFLVLHGLFDTTISPTQFTRFVQALRTAKAAVSAKRPLMTHVGIIIGLGSPFAPITLYARQVVQFLK